MSSNFLAKSLSKFFGRFTLRVVLIVPYDFEFLLNLVKAEN